jgi:hypothetical protein
MTGAEYLSEGVRCKLYRCGVLAALRGMSRISPSINSRSAPGSNTPAAIMRPYSSLDQRWRWVTVLDMVNAALAGADC